jgi:predicted metal-binding membrane protein
MAEGRVPRLTMNTLTARTQTTVLLVIAAVAAWMLTVARMWGMDAGPGTDLGGLGSFLGIWVTMTAAMMLPSAAPAAAHVARLARRFPTFLFVAGYLAVWTAYGLAAYGAFRLLTSLDTGWLAWDANGPYVVGFVLVAVGLYELTPVKQLSLRRCRSPEQPTSAFGSGLAHGVDCVGCSGGLMIALFVLGVMSLLWMALVAAVIFVEKVLPHGPRLSHVFAVAFVAFGIWVAASPGSVPGLVEPGGSPAMEMTP